jgi:glycosyltransferase involved in cell wall biosynthesis
MELPLVSIGIPTYNRPEGLRNALLGITRQTYANIEVIVSDNGSPGNEINDIMQGFCSTDQRVIFHRQEKNLGPTHNFRFVLEKATGDYFMWAADDDEWLGNDFLTNLMVYAPSNILTFPDAVLSGKGNVFEFPLHVYENCHSQIDYSKAFCSTGSGYPFYGLYNLPLFNQFRLKFQFDPDLQYYNEGTFIHKLFLAGPVKYVKEAKIKFSTESAKPSTTALLDSFLEYFKRTTLIYATSNLNFEEKKEIFDVIFSNYPSHFRGLVEENIFGRPAVKLNGVKRLKKAIKVLMTGEL